ncbi:MAG: hypothetical protein CSA54_00015 [Gammaproteobacteria bacterium]|nr:MAG: hypothetical protein CSA54_00015 [Gammaproteobacteria bacterium]
MTSFANRRKRQSRQQRSLQLSSARSAVFNLLLLDRLAAGDWLRLLPGEPAMLAGSRSWFVPKAAERDGMVGRLAELDVHPSGPWWGRGAPVAMDECAERERRVLADDECALLLAGLERAGLDQGRRALRALARELTAEWGPAGELVLNVTLERGVFATSLLRELGECVDLSRSAARSTSASASPGCRAGCDCRADAR